MAEVRMFLDQIEKLRGVAADARARESPDVARALEAIAARRARRAAATSSSRATPTRLAMRARMLDARAPLGWLSADEHRAELARMFGEHLAARTRRLGRRRSRLHAEQDRTRRAESTCAVRCLQRGATQRRAGGGARLPRQRRRRTRACCAR